MTAAILWASVVNSYDNKGLRTLTNIRDRSAPSIDTTMGESAAQEVIDLWAIYAQADFDATVDLHLAIGRQATIAVLWNRGGSATNIERIKWDTVFGDDGLLEKLRETNARSHPAPTSNSNVRQPSGLMSDGTRKLPWSHPDSFPINTMPSDRSANDVNL